MKMIMMMPMTNMMKMMMMNDQHCLETHTGHMVRMKMMMMTMNDDEEEKDD